MTQTIAIIGAGHMGAAFSAGIQKHMNRVRINLCDHSSEKLKALDAEHPYTDPREAIVGASVILLAVKPQSAKELLTNLSPALKDQFVISIMAGISISTLQKLTRSTRVIRAMPNLPAQVGKGLTGWVASPDVSASERALAKELFIAVGEEMELEKESLLDALTPLSGSGPAYFFYLAELLTTKAMKEGFSPTQAALIAKETLTGSAALLEADVRSPSEWRSAVTSKGGTTEAAFKTFQDEHLEDLFFKAVDRAIARSRELNQ